MADRRSGILLDLDGTLLDTNYLHTMAWVRALRDLGEQVSSNAVHRLVGMGADQLVMELLGHEVDGAASARARYYEELMPEAVALPGAVDLVAALRRHGLLAVLATSSPEDQLDAPLRLLGGRGTFDAITTADDAERSKPAPDIFIAACEAGNVDPSRAIAIGDSIWDVQAARAAGIACVGVETGGFSQHEMLEAGAVRVYRDVREIHDQLLTGPLACLIH